MSRKCNDRGPRQQRPSLAIRELKPCKICGDMFPACLNKPNIYCSRICRAEGNRRRVKEKNGIPTYEKNGITLSKSTKGALAEMRVTVDLIEKGYEVFRAVSPATSCDFVICKNNTTLRLEVKSRGLSSGGNIYKPPPHKADVIAILYQDEIIKYTPDLI